MNRALGNTVRRCVFFIAAFAVSAAVAAEEQLQKRYSDEQLMDILKDDGYRAVELSDDRVITIRIDGLTYVLYIYEDNDLQLYFGMSLSLIHI